MDFQFEISRRLSREHREVTTLLTHLETFMRSCGQGRQPDWLGLEARRIMGDLNGALRAEVPRHFAIEEQELFPLYAKDGGADMVDLLLADHEVILGLAEELKPLVQKTLDAADGLSQFEWETLRAKCGVFATELCAHAEKEEFGFVPELDALMDPPTAQRIFDRYQAM